MSAREDRELEDGVLAVFNGMKFKLNDLVDVIVLDWGFVETRQSHLKDISKGFARQ